jgi:predicted RNase H-like HicB family nuclease
LEELKANLREAIEVYLADDTSASAETASNSGQVLEIAV